MDEVCGNRAAGAVVEGREVSGPVKGGGDFVLEGVRSGEESAWFGKLESE